ncbi:glycerol dehydrogenase [Ruminiclostridium hungatei]|uniref:Glycerol dehydrogenase n=1 Tax=Ruminiclostridium hungatei TaxID=48256 RepID=A0A1V4SHY2_RUMHU|nr:iron-containing alcohol dehydrogenase [Ruminiclostridium hungatei]OPX43075.1 glycerol dehydrogenase [Ruminiclostridium hungatei]
MINVKTPELYVSEPGAIHLLGTLMGKAAAKAVVVWSETAKKVTQKDVCKSFENQGITMIQYEFAGYPNIDTASAIAILALNNGVDFIVGIGGGRVLDTSKAGGDIANIPVIAVPTIAATCAAWAALSVMYTKEGNFDHFRANRRSPEIVVADTTILAQAPVRYLKAGIADTLAKWYETSVGYDVKNSSLSYMNSVNGARLAYDFLLEKAEKVIRNFEAGIIDENSVRTIDAIIFLAGNVGSYVGEKAYSGFAHPFYHSSRIIRETRNKLHGEIVAFGLIVQAVLEEKKEKELLEIVEQFSRLEVAFTLEEIGLTEALEDKLNTISERINEIFPELNALSGKKKEAVVEAVYLADEYVKRFREGHKDD